MEEHFSNTRFSRLALWHLAHRLVLNTYHFSRTLPLEFRPGLSGPLQCAALKIPTSITKAASCPADAREAHFARARHALAEHRYYLLLCRDLDRDLANQELEQQSDELWFQLNEACRKI